MNEREIAGAIAATIAELIGLEMLARDGQPAPGVAVQMAIDEYIRGFWPLLECAADDDGQEPHWTQLTLPTGGHR